MRHRAHEPLPARDDLERAVALLVELHRVRDRARLADQQTGLGQGRHDVATRLRSGATDQAFVIRGAVGGGSPTGEVRLDEPTVAADDRPDRQAQLALPLHVGRVAERTDHGDAGALGRVGQTVRVDRHGHIEQRRCRRTAEKVLVALVIRVRDQGDARRQQLRPRRFDLDRAGAVDGHAESDPVVRRRDVSILLLGLGHGGLEVDVPRGRRECVVDLARGQFAQELPLRRALRLLADRRVRHRPVDREAELAPQRFVRLLVLDRELRAQLDEVPPGEPQRGSLALGRVPRRHRRRHVRHVRQRRVAPHVEIVLHAALGRQAVVVEAHGVEHFGATHPPEPGDHVGVRVAEHVPDVQAAAHRRRRRVDGVDLVTRTAPVEPVGRLGVPALGVLVFDAVQRGFLGHGGNRPGHRWVTFRERERVNSGRRTYSTYVRRACYPYRRRGRARLAYQRRRRRRRGGKRASRAAVHGDSSFSATAFHAERESPC